MTDCANVDAGVRQVGDVTPPTCALVSFSEAEPSPAISFSTLTRADAEDDMTAVAAPPLFLYAGGGWLVEAEGWAMPTDQQNKTTR